MGVRSRLRRLGEMDGLVEADFRRVLGEPVSVIGLEGGGSLVHWRSGHLRVQKVGVLFDGDQRFVRVYSRISV